MTNTGGVDVESITEKQCMKCGEVKQVTNFSLEGIKNRPGFGAIHARRAMPRQQKRTETHTPLIQQNGILTLKRNGRLPAERAYRQREKCRVM